MNDLASQMASATRAFQGGDFVRARDLAQRAAERAPANAQVLQFLGIAQVQSGDAQQGFATLKRAVALVPGDKQLRLNAAQAAIDAGAPGEVAALCAPLGQDPAAQQVIAQAAKLTGDAASAAELLSALAAENPRDVRVLNNYGNALIEVSRIDEAIAVLTRATELEDTRPHVWLNLGRARSVAQQFDAAIAAFERASALDPQDPEVNFELGKSLLRYGRHEDALLRFSEAARAGKRDPEVLVLIASCYAGMERRAEAEQAYRVALSIDPCNPRGVLNLALQLERENRLDDLQNLVEESREAGLAGPELAYCEALLLRRDGNLEAALELVEENEPEGLDTYVRAQLIGQLADRMGDSDTAFGAFSEMNRTMGLAPDALRHKGTEYTDLVDQATAAMNPGWFDRWTGSIAQDARRSPAFLGGFLRSGTTLLDTILMGHDGTEVREEQPMIARLQDVGGSIEGLPTLPPAQIAAMRAAYFAELRAGGAVSADKLVIDKYPLMTLRAAYVHRAFPDAKFVFALRHPCDVVLSCFMQNFRVTSAMSSFLTLENSARFYDAAMAHWQRAREILPLDVHTVRYEDMVQDLEGELRPLIAFLGLEWDDALLNHQQTARDRGYIRTPSYAQVTEKIYTRSSGRWEAYRKHMEPILPILAPWVEEFGYAPL